MTNNPVSQELAELIEEVREMGAHPCRAHLPMGATLRHAADAIERLSRPVGDYVVERLSTTLLMARSWVNNHASHCLSLVAPQAEDGPYNQCNCCLPEKLEVIDAALSSIPVSTEAPYLREAYMQAQAKVVQRDTERFKHLYPDQGKPDLPDDCIGTVGSETVLQLIRDRNLAAEPSGEVVQADARYQIASVLESWTEDEALTLPQNRLLCADVILAALYDHYLALSHPSERAQIVALLRNEAGPQDSTLIFETINGLADAIEQGAHLSTPSDTAGQTDREKGA